MTYKVLFKKFHPNAVIPAKAYDTDFCYDVVATSKEEIKPGVYKYGLGFGVAIQDEKDILSIDFRPRSSVWKTGLVLSNCVGTIDKNYRGEISAIFYHVVKDLPPYEVGDRIGQIKLGITAKLDFQIVDNLDSTDRGTGGFGSTGK